MTTTADRLLDATSLLHLATSYRNAQALLAAVELDLFTLLSHGALPEQDVRQRLGLRPHLSADFLDALVALRVLRRDEHGEYGNERAAQRYPATCCQSNQSNSMSSSSNG